jgi:Phage protein (N4 Gp49/phage Sf6 gene 66) family
MPETNEAQVEELIRAKGLGAARMTPRQIDEQIVSEHYHEFPGSTVTVCDLELRNGFWVTASAANYDPEIGRKVARDRARAKIWALEGYLLRSHLADAGY